MEPTPVKIEGLEILGRVPGQVLSIMYYGKVVVATSTEGTFAIDMEGNVRALPGGTVVTIDEFRETEQEKWFWKIGLTIVIIAVIIGLCFIGDKAFGQFVDEDEFYGDVMVKPSRPSTYTPYVPPTIALPNVLYGTAPSVTLDPASPGVYTYTWPSQGGGPAVQLPGGTYFYPSRAGQPAVIITPSGRQIRVWGSR